MAVADAAFPLRSNLISNTCPDTAPWSELSSGEPVALMPSALISMFDARSVIFPAGGASAIAAENSRLTSANTAPNALPRGLFKKFTDRPIIDHHSQFRVHYRYRPVRQRRVPKFHVRGQSSGTHVSR